MPRHVVEGDPVSLLPGYIPVGSFAPDPLVSTVWINTSSLPPAVLGWDPVEEEWVEIGGGGGGDGSFAATVGDGVETTFDVEHSLATTAVVVGAWEVATGQSLSPAALVLDADTVRVTFSASPAFAGARVVVLSSGGAAGGGGGGGGGVAVYSPGDVPPVAPAAQNDEFRSSTLDPSWTLLNQGAGSSFQPTPDGLICAVGSDNTQMRPIVKPVPSGNFRFTVAVHELFHNQIASGTFGGFSMLVLNSASDQAQTVTIWDNDGGSHWRWHLNRQFYSPLSNRTDHFSLVPGHVPAGPLYLQMDAYLDGSTWRRIFRYSLTGQLWSHDIDATRAIGFTPAFMGFSLYNRDGATGVKALVRWFRVEALT